MLDVTTQTANVKPTDKPAIAALITHVEEQIGEVEDEITILDAQIEELEDEKADYERKLWHLEEQLQELIDLQDGAAK